MKKEVLYFLGGLVLGGITAGIATYAYTKKKFEKVVNDELNKIRKDADQKVTDIYDQNLVAKKPTQEELKAEEDALKAGAKPITKIDYAAYAKEKPSIDEDGKLEGEPDIYDGPEIGPLEDDSRIPYVISAEDVESKYDIVSLTYYERDGTLADDQTLDIVPAEDTVSTKLLNEFINSEEDDILICKESQSTVYEITRYLGSYSEEVLGLHDEGGEEDGDYNTE